MQKDICIIGAGAAGLTAAIFASRSGKKVTIIESNTTAGRKLLKTGGGRCNITHQHTVDEFLRACNPYSRFLRHCSYEFSPDDVCEFFQQNGLMLKTEPDGCVFPITNRANDVLRILVDLARRGKVEFVYAKPIAAIEKNGNVFNVKTESLNIEAKSVIIATGGCSLQMTGSTGDGYRFAQSLGHTVNPPRACLVPLVAKESWVGEISGVALKNAVLSAKVGKKKIKLSGPVIFTSTGIGGPVVLNFSREILEQISEADVEISLDLMPDFDQESVEKFILEKIAENPKKELAGIFVGYLPRALAIMLCDMLGPKKAIIANQLSRKQRNLLVSLIKNLPMTVTATRPINEATVTRGGVSIDEIDSKTMQSKIVDGLFFAGEVIDVDGPCGGYNLQIAWSTGALAGKCAADFAD